MNSSLFIGKIKRKGAVGRRGCKKPTDLNLALGQKGQWIYSRVVKGEVKCHGGLGLGDLG